MYDRLAKGLKPTTAIINRITIFIYLLLHVPRVITKCPHLVHFSKYTYLPRSCLHLNTVEVVVAIVTFHVHAA